jgi:hypothetical protein
MNPRNSSRDWRELSLAASQEHDPEKLLRLVRELNETLEREEEEFRRKARQSF